MRAEGSKHARLRRGIEDSGYVAPGTEREDMEPDLEMPTIGALEPARAKLLVRSGGPRCV